MPPDFGRVIRSLKQHDVEFVRSKRAAGRPKDKAVLPVLEETLRLRKRERQ
jgi:hypothetical protein